MKKSAFTLIELLVVIAIIAILAGIALPVFSTAMERGRAAQDLSNLRQLGIGTIAYLADNNDQIFPNGGTGTGAWPSLLYGKYVANPAVFKSPFDTRTAGTPPTGSDMTGVPVSYGINPNILPASAPTSSSSSTIFTGNTTTYTTPSQLIYMAPNIDVSQTNTVTFMATSTGGNSVLLVIPTTQSSTLGTHAHRSQINALYADSHVAGITYMTFSTNANPNYQWVPVIPPSATSL